MTDRDDRPLTAVFHERTQRCLGGSHNDCWAVERMHREGDHRVCLMTECDDGPIRVVGSDPLPKAAEDSQAEAFAAEIQRAIQDARVFGTGWVRFDRNEHDLFQSKRVDPSQVTERKATVFCGICSEPLLFDQPGTVSAQDSQRVMGEHLRERHPETLKQPPGEIIVSDGWRLHVSPSTEHFEDGSTGIDLRLLRIEP